MSVNRSIGSSSFLATTGRVVKTTGVIAVSMTGGVAVGMASGILTGVGCLLGIVGTQAMHGGNTIVGPQGWRDNLIYTLFPIVAIPAGVVTSIYVTATSTYSTADSIYNYLNSI